MRRLFSVLWTDQTTCTLQYTYNSKGGNVNNVIIITIIIIRRKGLSGSNKIINQNKIRYYLNLLQGNGVNVSIPLHSFIQILTILKEIILKDSCLQNVGRVYRYYDFFTLKIKAPKSLEMSVTICQST